MAVRLLSSSSSLIVSQRAFNATHATLNVVNTTNTNTNTLTNTKPSAMAMVMATMGGRLSFGNCSKIGAFRFGESKTKTKTKTKAVVFASPSLASPSPSQTHRMFSSGASSVTDGAVDGSISAAANRQMVIFFTCNVCQTRSAKQFSKSSYESGIVLVRCSGCKNLHVIADHRGSFGDKHTTIDQLLAAKGESVTHLRESDLGSFEISQEDLANWKSHLEERAKSREKVLAGKGADSNNANSRDDDVTVTSSVDASSSSKSESNIKQPPSRSSSPSSPSSSSSLSSSLFSSPSSPIPSHSLERSAVHAQPCVTLLRVIDHSRFGSSPVGFPTNMKF